MSPSQTESSSLKGFSKTNLTFLTDYSIRINENQKRNQKLMPASTWQLKIKLENDRCKWALEVPDLEAVMIKNPKIKKINRFLRAIHPMMHIHQTCETQRTHQFRQVVQPISQSRIKMRRKTINRCGLIFQSIQLAEMGQTYMSPKTLSQVPQRMLKLQMVMMRQRTPLFSTTLIAPFALPLKVRLTLIARFRDRQAGLVSDGALELISTAPFQKKTGQRRQHK